MKMRNTEAKRAPTSPAIISEFHYRPEIDGLRAIAVLAVVLFHADLGVSGGFVGVDVFFVISGYLITSLILKDLESHTFSFVNFCERRARRIMPAAVVMMLTVLAAGWWLLLPADYVHLAKSVIWQAVFSANVFFWRNTDYFARSAEELPLLHMWSLAVEEQFYLLFPALLFGLLQCHVFRRRVPLAIVFGIAFILSLGSSAVLVSRSPASAFYLLPSRVWELLCGSLVAIVPPLSASVPRWLREALAVTGLGCILVPCFLYTKQTAFPGLAALPPCLGTGLVIAACNVPGRLDAPNRFAPPAVSQLLAIGPLVFTGLISYSLYLWHWPIFAFTAHWALEAVSFTHRVAMVVAGFLLATLSYRFVETPFRHRRLCKSPTSMFLHAGVGLAAMVATAFVIFYGAGFRYRFSQTVLAIDSTKAESLPRNRITQQVSLEDALDKRFPRLGDPSPSPVRLLVWGDSHARSILPAVDQLGRERRSGVLAAWHTSTPPVLQYVPDHRFQGFSLGADCPAYNAAVLDFIATRRVPVVLLAARWSMYFESESDSHPAVEEGVFARGLVETVRRIRATGSAPWILMEVPKHRTNVPKALVCHELFGMNVSRFAATPDTVLIQNQHMSELVPILQEAGAQIVDLSTLLEDSTRKSFRMEHERRPLYYDDNHLSRYGALFVREAVAPIFKDD